MPISDALTDTLTARILARARMGDSMDDINDPATDEWGPFGRPIFGDALIVDDAAARALARIGVVDVGSNSVRLVVFDGASEIGNVSKPG